MGFWENNPPERLLGEASLWSADFSRLGDEIRRVDDYVDFYHIDVCDAHFVPQLLFFPDLVASLRPLTRKPFHVHLMVENPLILIDDFARAGANLISIHSENGPLVPASIQRIHDLRLGVGLAIGLDIPLENVLPYLDQLDLVLLMGTPMGVKGQSLSHLACPRIARMRGLLEQNGLTKNIRIGADGGIRLQTVPDLCASGADNVVMGSLLFKNDDPQHIMSWIHSLPAHSQRLPPET